MAKRTRLGQGTMMFVCIADDKGRWERQVKGEPRANGDGCRVQLSPYSHPFILIFVVIEKIFDLSPAISGPLILHQPSHY